MNHGQSRGKPKNKNKGKFIKSTEMGTTQYASLAMEAGRHWVRPRSGMQSLYMVINRGAGGVRMVLFMDEVIIIMRHAEEPQWL